MKRSDAAKIAGIVVVVLGVLLGTYQAAKKKPPSVSITPVVTISKVTETSVPDTPVGVTETAVAESEISETPVTETLEPAPSDTQPPATETEFVPSPTPAPTLVPATATTGPLPTSTSAAVFTPWPSAPLCLDTGEFHDTSKFHTLWNSSGCHYDHEHGINPFTPEAAAAFPGFDLKVLGCGMEVNHCSPSSPIENTWDGKHGGWKWDVTIPSFSGCVGFESAPIGISAAVIGYHTFGNYSVELNGRLHSALILSEEKSCNDPTHPGYVYITSIQDYGQRTVPYQGDIMPYPDTPNPAYDPPRGPYISFDCVGQKSAGERGACRESLAFVLGHNANANSIWTSKKTGGGVAAVQGNALFQLLFRVRDTFQLVDWTDLIYPFTFKWICSDDNGVTYAPKVGCRYNNSTSKVQEVRIVVPSIWDGLVGVDQDGLVNGRITGEFLVTKFGDLAPTGVCLQPNMTCFKVKYLNAIVGVAGGQLIDGKFPQFSPEGQPERDIYFCGQVVCAETAPGAKASGWIGSGN